MTTKLPVKLPEHVLQDGARAYESYLDCNRPTPHIFVDAMRIAYVIMKESFERTAGDGNPHPTTTKGN